MLGIRCTASLRRCRAGRVARGFTIVELAVVVALFGILAAMATPPLRQMVLQQRVRNAAFDLNSALLFTRSEALKRNVNVVLQSKSGTNDWSSGWLVQGTVSGTTVTLKEWGAYSSVLIAGSAVNVTFQRSGRATAAVEFSVAEPSGADEVVPRCITLDVLGKATSEAGDCP